eukprot:scaffold32099_cov20-Cyclotella_meneghiniana.AAC.1
MVVCAAADGSLCYERRHELGKRGIESNRRRGHHLAVLLLLLSVQSECNASYSGSNIKYAGCFVHPSRIKHHDGSYRRVSVPLSSSTKEEYYYDAYQDDIMTRERRSKKPRSRTSLMQYKVHKKKRNKKLRDYFNNMQSSGAVANGGGIERSDRIKQKQSKRR